GTQSGEHGKREDLRGGLFRRGKAAPLVSPLSVAFLQMDWHRIVKAGPNALPLERLGNAVTVRRTDDIEVIHAAAVRRFVRQHDAGGRKRRKQVSVPSGGGAALRVP